jgi:molecular chaperone DnaK
VYPSSGRAGYPASGLPSSYPASSSELEYSSGESEYPSIGLELEYSQSSGGANPSSPSGSPLGYPSPPSGARPSSPSAPTQSFASPRVPSASPPSFAGAPPSFAGAPPNFAGAPPNFSSPSSAPIGYPPPSAPPPSFSPPAPVAPAYVPPAPVLLEVTPRALGIATVAGFSETLIRRNARVPTEARKLFTTSRDRQDTVRIVVCQGESRRLDQNVVIGDLVLQNLPPRPRGETSIEVTFSLDAGGVLQVRARDAQTGAEQRATLALVGDVAQEEVAASRERLQQLKR